MKSRLVPTWCPVARVSRQTGERELETPMPKTPPWTAEDEQQAEAYAEATQRHIHRCGGEVFYMIGHYECMGCGWLSKDAPAGKTPRRWQVRAEND
jgi:hypothetical protein